MDVLTFEDHDMISKCIDKQNAVIDHIGYVFSTCLCWIQSAKSYKFQKSLYQQGSSSLMTGNFRETEKIKTKRRVYRITVVYEKLQNIWLLKCNLHYHQILTRYYISLQMYVAPDLIYITLYFIYSKLNIELEFCKKFAKSNFETVSC